MLKSIPETNSTPRGRKSENLILLEIRAERACESGMKNLTFPQKENQRKRPKVRSNPENQEKLVPVNKTRRKVGE